tara:strand:+ start:1311 stop:1838 length:528 start_codon:yes stop_codon:yes gene_type:complete
MKIFFKFAVTFTSLIFYNTIFAEEQLSGKNFNDWSTFSCFMASQAIKMEAFKNGERLSSVNREIGRFYVTKNKSNENKIESTFYAGYPLLAGSQATLKIDEKKSFILFSHPDPSNSQDKEYAWVHPDQDIQLIKALKKGNKAVVEATSHTNKVTKDTFSLSGFSKAYENLQKTCS